MALAAYQAIPAIYPWPEYTVLAAAALSDAYRQVGVDTAKILKGAKPADLPVQEAVKIELILKTAKSLGITFPLSLLGRAPLSVQRYRAAASGRAGPRKNWTNHAKAQAIFS